MPAGCRNQSAGASPFPTSKLPLQHHTDHRNWRSLISDDTYAYSMKNFKKAATYKESSFVEGDIIRAVEKINEVHDASGRRFLNAVIQTAKTWPRGIIPYRYDVNFDWPERETIRNAMNEVEWRTCVRFIEWTGDQRYTNHDDYLLIEKSRSCASYIGRMNVGEQVVSLATGCMNKIGEIQHELLHALGLYHEQSRMDRDDYVHIVWENIFTAPGQDLASQFQKYESDHFDLPYDYNSIMHYGHNYFSRSAHLPTIIPRNRYGRQQKVQLGNREQMSDTDVRKINILYKCSQLSDEHSPTTPEASTPTVTRKPVYRHTQVTRKRYRAIPTTTSTRRPVRATRTSLSVITRRPVIVHKPTCYRLQCSSPSRQTAEAYAAAKRRQQLRDGHRRVIWRDFKAAVRRKGMVIMVRPNKNRKLLT